MNSTVIKTGCNSAIKKIAMVTVLSYSLLVLYKCEPNLPITNIVF